MLGLWRLSGSASRERDPPPPARISAPFRRDFGGGRRKSPAAAEGTREETVVGKKEARATVRGDADEQIRFTVLTG